MYVQLGITSYIHGVLMAFIQFYPMHISCETCIQSNIFQQMYYIFLAVKLALHIHVMRKMV